MSDTVQKKAGPAGRALVLHENVAPRVRLPFLTWQRAALAASLFAVFGVGAVGTRAAQVAWARFGHSQAAQVDAAQTVHRLQDEVARLKSSVEMLRAAAADSARQDDSLKTLKHNVEALKTDLQQTRAADGASLQQIAAKIEKPDHDPSAKLADIVARLDRIEHEPPAAKPVAAADTAPAKIADLSARLDRIEREVAAPMATGSIPATARPAAPAVTTVSRALPPVPAKAEEADDKGLAAKPQMVDAWVVRDVYDGMALVQARHGGLREIGPGEYLPGAGQVRSIERRGRTWVVMTSRGMIGTDTF